MNLNKFWRIYEITNESKDLPFSSWEFGRDSNKWEIVSVQVFEKGEKLFISVLWDQGVVSH